MKKSDFPRRGLIRLILKTLIFIALKMFTKLEIIGKENMPKGGPLVVVANHFSFADPVMLIRITPWKTNFIAAAVPGFAPDWAGYFPKLWGAFWVYRGTGSRNALRTAEDWLKSGGVLCVFPEGGAWAQVLRPPRPGAAYLAIRGNAKILPVGIVGLENLFPLRLRNRPVVKINIGQPFGPLKMSGRGRERREQLDQFGHTIMEKVAELIPEDNRGRYSDDPAIREAAKEFEIYPWEDAVEGEVTYEKRND
jgi:1-acyl-sn-glycerol-3-phosphate acyltransferase